MRYISGSSCVKNLSFVCQFKKRFSELNFHILVKNFRKPRTRKKESTVSIRFLDKCGRPVGGGRRHPRENAGGKESKKGKESFNGN